MIEVIHMCEEVYVRPVWFSGVWAVAVIGLLGCSTTQEVDPGRYDELRAIGMELVEAHKKMSKLNRAAYLDLVRTTGEATLAIERAQCEADLSEAELRRVQECAAEVINRDMDDSRKDLERIKRSLDRDRALHSVGEGDVFAENLKASELIRAIEDFATKLEGELGAVARTIGQELEQNRLCWKQDISKASRTYASQLSLALTASKHFDFAWSEHVHGRFRLAIQRLQNEAGANEQRQERGTEADESVSVEKPSVIDDAFRTAVDMVSKNALRPATDAIRHACLKAQHRIAKAKCRSAD